MQLIIYFFMADTIITNTPGTSNDGGSAGWIVALVIVLVVIVGGVLAYQKGYFHSAKDSTTNIQVTIPNPITPAPTN